MIFVAQHDVRSQQQLQYGNFQRKTSTCTHPRSEGISGFVVESGDLALRHSIPFQRNIAMAAAPKLPLHMPMMVKYHPLPVASNSGCKIATPAAAIAQRVMLVAAAAVLGLRGKLSTRSVLYVV